jgi:exopolysaccharide biosynthesis polyprenyl glycosylphosphotransferase
MDLLKNRGGNIEAERLFGHSFLTLTYTPHKEWQIFLKRLIDMILSLIALIVLSPVFLLIALAIKLEDGGPVFYEWRVVGFNKKPFISWKFRSMVVNADKLKENLLKNNEMQGPVFKMKNDPRITLVGKFLRRFSLDELPQLYSVLKGDMSMVGPRPPLVTEVNRFEKWCRRKLSVKPGITCLWQVNGRNRISRLEHWVKLDLEYIDNWSLWLDFKILLKTIGVVIMGTGY